VQVLEQKNHKRQKITRDRNNQNILAQANLLLIPRPVGFSQVSKLDFDRTHPGMDVGETPTLLEGGSVLDGLLIWMTKVGVRKICGPFGKGLPEVGSLPIFRLPLIPKSSMS
jgi:hypothetical protein